MLGFLQKLFGAPKLQVIPAPTALGQLSPWRYSFDDGSKFAGGFGPTQVLLPDYWTLRARSAELFETNLYARGIIRRLVTNVINTGLFLEATPEETILGESPDGLADWCENAEIRFSLWCDSAKLCDQSEQMTFGALQAAAYSEALISGDVLVVMRNDARTGLPRVQLISGAKVQTPFGVELGNSNTIKHGVELDSSGRHVAYWILQDDRTSKRLPAFGEKSGRKLAWLVYGTDKRLDDVRGKPMLSLVLQSLKEVDRYRDAKQRAAVVSGMLALFVKKTEDKPGTLPMMGGAVRRGVAIADGSGSVTEPRTFRTAEHVPGLVIDELQHGEEPTAFQSNVVTEGFGVFEEAIIQAIAWAYEIPPEILTLSFNSNYSASQAAINEFKMFLNRVRTGLGDCFCRPIYIEWLLAETTAKKIKAPGLLEAWRDSSQYDVFAAWTSSDWSAQIKPSVDMTKVVGGYAAGIKEGFITRARSARETFGTKYSKNVAQLERENEQLADASAPLAALEAAAKAPSGSDAGKKDALGQGEDGTDDVIEGVSNYPRRRALALIAGK